MDNAIDQLKPMLMMYVHSLWRFRWLSLFVVWGIFTVGVFSVDSLSERYTSEAKLHIDTSSVLRPLLRGLAIQTDIQSEVRLMTRTLLTRPNLERAARLMDMDIKVNSDKEMETLINRLKANITIISPRRSDIYTITYTDTDPQVAKRMVQVLLDIFVEDVLGKGQEQSDSALDFLDQQINKYDGLLAEAEKRLEVFKRQNAGLLPGSGGDYYSQMQSEKGTQRQAELSLDEAINRRNELKKQLKEQEENRPSIVEEPNTMDFTSPLDGRIAQMQQQLDGLMLKFTENHPDIKILKRTLADLEGDRQKEFERYQQQLVMQEAEQSVLGENPIIQQLQVLLSETEATVASLQARVSSYKKRVTELEKVVDRVPQVEAELKRVNRDYEVLKKNYNELVSRREQARLSEDVESGTEQVKFRVVEPPHAPSKPSFPNRPLFDSGVFVAALAIGNGLGLLIALLNPVFYRPNELREYTELPILGAVSRKENANERRRKRIGYLLFLAGNIMLIALWIKIMMVHNSGELLFTTVREILPEGFSVDDLFERAKVATGGLF